MTKNQRQDLRFDNVVGFTVSYFFIDENENRDDAATRRMEIIKDHAILKITWSGYAVGKFFFHGHW